LGVPTNNASERALRQPVIWRRLSFGTQSAAGSRFVETILTVLAPCQQQQRNVLDFLSQSLASHHHHHHGPSLRHNPPPPRSRLTDPLRGMLCFRTGCERLRGDGFWESWVTVAVARHLQAGMCCVDVGANYGYYTLLMASFVGPEGRIIACEPIPSLANAYRYYIRTTEN